MSAEAVVGSLLGNLKPLLADRADLISGVKELVPQLVGDLELLAAFVRDASRKRGSDGALQELVSQIRDLVYEVEDDIDAFVTYMAVQKARGFLAGAFHIDDYPARLRAVARSVEGFRIKVDEVYQKNQFGLEKLPVDDGRGGKKKAPILEEDNIVGLDSESKSVIHHLTGGSSDLEVISIVGVSGLRKTTLAKKILKDLEIEYEFFIRVWICISQEYVRKEVFLSILRSVTNITGEIERLTEVELAEELSRKLEAYKYLIVLDDVWTPEAWKDLKVAFPNNKKGSRILITSRELVASQANPKNHTHFLKLLTFDESWELLQRKVFGNEICPPDSELMKLGKQIAKKCEGLPLTIVLIAGILLDKGNILEEWESVAKGDMCMDKWNAVADLSYNQLPYNLKACFLYFAVFPEDFEVPIWKLIRLWIAEGFIQKKPDEEESLEVTAERYLHDLLNRNLVIVEQRKWNGQIKTCRVHDLLYFFCKKKAAEENFLQEIKGQLSTTDLAKLRRLSVHFNVSNYLSSGPSGQRVRSFLCFSSESITLSREEVLSVHGAFKLLRVLDINPIKFPLFPPDLVQLVHLRYLSLSCDSKIVPKTISGLWNMQNLIIGTSSRTLEIEGEILWKMLQLRHVNTNASTFLSTPPIEGNAENLQTLSTISPESCTEDLLTNTPNLKKLGIRGKLATLLGEKGRSNLFENIGKLQHLENLKLFNDEFLGGQQYDGKPFALPTVDLFPPKLKKLTLSDTSLSWDLMSILAMLENLEVLKLKDYAFKGANWWNQMDGGFLQLKVLHIERTDVVSWQASAHHFPRLQCVFLRNCSYLKALPCNLAEISSLHRIELYSVTPDACKCAKTIADRKKEKKEKGRNEFKLSIYPPDHWPKF